jgi:hypothetical protein
MDAGGLVAGVCPANRLETAWMDAVDGCQIVSARRSFASIRFDQEETGFHRPTPAGRLRGCSAG